MKRRILSSISLTLILICAALAGRAQTTVATGLTGSASAAATGVNVFGVTNNNTYPIAVTGISDYHNVSNNNKNYSIWYHPTAITGAPTVNAANGWTSLGTSANVPGTATTGLRVILNNLYVVIPAGATYRFAVVMNNGATYFSNTGVASYSNGGVSIQTGASTVSAGYSGTTPSPTLTPRYFAGSITFVTAAVNNLAAIRLLTPVTNTTYCSYDSVPVQVVIMNNGANPQSNFPVTARYSNATSTGTISANYSELLAPFATDTFLVGKLNLPQGTYSIRAFTDLSTDTVKMNDTTTPAVSITFRKPLTPPVVVTDTVCPGGNATVSINGLNNTTYKWYSEQTGGTLLTSGTSLSFANLVQDTVMWVVSDSAGCESDRVPIAAVVGTPPNPYLGPDTSFCESIPLLLDAANTGASYLWNTGDTDQVISVTNVSGLYWVEVTKYCTVADTISITIRPLPSVTGISYVRMANTYWFTPSSVQNVESYEWHFGDGGISTDSFAVHTYASGINTALNVMLIVKNTCSADTVYRTVPTGVDDPLEQGRVRIYPNPARDQLFVEATEAKLQQITLVNIAGSTVLRREATPGARQALDVSMLPPGTYMLRLRTEAGDIGYPVQLVR